MVPTDSKDLIVIAPQAIQDNTQVTATEIDTLGYQYLIVKVVLGATDIAMTALKLQESATSGSGFADITGMVYGTSTNSEGITSTLPSDTDDNSVFRFELDLRGRERYIDLVATVGDGAAGTFIIAQAELWNGENAPTTATEKGCAQVLQK